MPTSRPSAPRLSHSVLLCFLLGAILLGAGLGSLVPEYSRAVSDRALQRLVESHTRSAALDYARALHDDWEAVHHLARSIATLSPEDARIALDGLVASGTRVSWAGLAGLDGRVISASKGMLEGADVSTRPWFAGGLRGGFAGDVHDAVLLNRLLGGTDEAPVRFIDLAVPVNDPAGEPAGVLGVHLTFDWVQRFLRESAAVRGLDLMLVDAGGQVVFTTDPSVTDASTVAALRAAVTGVSAPTRETWPDGREYFAMTVSDVTYAELPSFGWRLVGRVPTDFLAADQRALSSMLIAIIAGAIGIFALAAALFDVVYVRPLSRLVEDSERIAAGEPVYPHESRSSAEAQRLSWALARLQSRLDAKAAPATLPP